MPKPEGALLTAISTKLCRQNFNTYK